MFHQSKKSTTRLKKPLNELQVMGTVDGLLSQPKIHQLLERIEKAFTWENVRYQSYCLTLMKRLLMFCEALPDSTHFYTERGGLFEYALQRAEAALSLFSGYLIVNEDEALSEKQQCWEYALFSAALLYGIGKLYIDYQVDLFDAQGGFIKTWNPLGDNLIFQAPHYAMKVEHQPNQPLRARLNLLLAQKIMPEIGMDWISSDPEIFEAWLALLNEDLYGVKVLGVILSRADTLALQKAMEQWLDKQRSLKSKAYGTFAQPAADSPQDLATQTGLQFIHWLKNQLEQGEIVLNEGMVMVTKDGLSLNADLFKLFLKDFPNFKNFQAVQKGFLSLGFHDASVNTADILFAKFGFVLPTKAKFYNASTKTNTWVDATELTHFVSQGAQPTSGKSLEASMSLPKLNQKGVWQAVETQGAFLKPGASSRG